MKDIKFIQDLLVGEIYFTDEDIRNILIRDMIYEPYMEQYFPELIANVDKALNTITQLVDRHIMHKLNNHPYCWDTSKLSLQVENVEDLCNANFPDGQKAAKEVNDRINMVICCDTEQSKCNISISLKPYGDKHKTDVFTFTYEDKEYLRNALIDFLFKLYNGTYMCDMVKEIPITDNIYFGYHYGKDLGDNCFMLLGPIKTMLKMAKPILKDYMIKKIKSHIALYEPITEVNPNIRYKNGKPYLEYR